MKFDIILPTIGRDGLLRAMDSVIEQSHANWNLIIVCDGTLPSECYVTDNITPYVIDGPNNDFGAKARNTGIPFGEAEWITYIDDDDEWLPHHLANLANIIEVRENVDMIRSAGTPFWLKHKSPRSSKLVRKYGNPNFEDILTVGMAHTRELFAKTEGWQPRDNHDRLLWQAMSAAGGHAFISNQVTFHFKR